MESVIKKNNIKIIGNSEEVLMFAHGYGCDQSMWRFVTPAFSEKYKIVLIDLVGSGNSDPSYYNFQKYSSLTGYANDIIEICDSLNLKNVTLVAHSVSCMIGALACIERPELFKNLIMVGPSPCYINDGDYPGGFSPAELESLSHSLESNYLGWSSAITPTIMGNSDKPELTEELTNSFCRNDPERAIHFAKVTFGGDNRKDLPLISTPTLVIQCSEDFIAPLAVGKFVHSAIKHSKFTLLKATGHCPHLSAPKETIEAIQAYLLEQK